jgi:DNA polymerase
MLFYDFEVFKEDWLVVVIDMKNKKEHVIINDPAALEKLHSENVNEIWVGFNSRHYDQYILKGILCGFDPKKINDYIIVKGNPGWKFSSLLRNVKLINYDVMTGIDRGLKTFEGFMGNNIKESSVPFDIDRKLTQAELEETVKYCRHDVEQTVEVFLERKDDFEAHMGLVKLACKGKPLDLFLLSRTKVQLSSIILDAVQKDHDDEFDIDFPSTMKIEKYTEVVDWYKNPENRKYNVDPDDPKSKKNQLDIMVAGVPHVFGWGGVHGAIDKYSGEGYYLNMDVASLYPSLMIQYNLGSRNMKDPNKYEEIYHTRLQYKAEKNPLQLPLKLVLNGTYGAMKDKNNQLYDPRQANRVCVYGQLLLLDLIEKLEPHCQIIQSNTDGVLIKMHRYEDFDLIDDICYEWEQRTHLQLEFEEFRKVFQKDVNNYIIVDASGKYKSKGGYVKKLNSLDYDLPIVNKALINYMVKNIPVEKTVGECDDLKEFQLVQKISGKYTHILHGDKVVKEKCIRMFASTLSTDKGVQKVHATTGRPAKMPNSPESCFIFNDEVNGVKVPKKLDKQWYIDLANKRLADFGVI